MDLSDAQWAILKPLLQPQGRAEGRGRPWRDARAVLNGVLWVLRTGAPWHDLPSPVTPCEELPAENLKLSVLTVGLSDQSSHPNR